MMTHLKIVAGDSEFEPQLVERLKTRYPVEGQLEVLDSWRAASKIEKTRWKAAGEAVEARVDGGMYDLVEDLVQDRAFGKSSGVYFAPGAAGDQLVYAARRLTQAGMKVAYLDWEAGQQAVEELLSSEIPVIDILEGADSHLGDLGAGGTVQLGLNPEAGDQEFLLVSERAGNLFKQLEGVDVLIFVTGPGTIEGNHSSTARVTIDTWAMASRSVGRLAGAWGASVLATGGLANVSAPEAWEKLLATLVSEMQLMEAEL